MILRNLQSFSEKIANTRSTPSKGDRDQLFVFEK